MTEDQYKTLCAICDSVLGADGAPFERMAIPWLHVMREHPVFLRQYEDLFVPRPWPARFIRHWWRAGLDIARSLRLFWRVARSSGKLWHGDLPKCAPIDVVFVSHLLAVSQLVAEDDFYFGTVPAELAREGKSVLLVLINHTDVICDELDKALLESPIPRVVISSMFSLKEEFLIWRRTAKEAKSLHREARIARDGLHKTVLRRASVEATSSSTKKTIRISRVLAEVVSRCQANCLVTTYEGHAWERVVYAAARDAIPGIACVGYQHAAMFRLQHAAKRTLGEKYDPTKILAAGLVGLNQLQNARNLSGIHLGVLGSNRSIKTIPRIDSAACLVLPEGIVEECGILFTFSLTCAQASPKVKFIWRLHPVIVLDELIRRMPILGNLPSNIEISTQTFEEDIARSSWALYRGSTAVVSAAANGVLPIYLEQSGELSIDPLYEISDHRPAVATVEQFTAALDWRKWTATSKDYCIRFYTPMNSLHLSLDQ